MNKYGTKIYTSVKDDRCYLENCKRLLTKLPRGSVITGYQLVDKKPEDRFDNQSCWLDVYYEKDGEKFRTRSSHKNNQFLRINF